ncbi:MAG TPA: hypothetical protein VNN72_26725 [Polyangiaceae bacterium]|nr:hypothetical protein [Polyangiaceae bacterium]
MRLSRSLLLALSFTSLLTAHCGSSGSSDDDDDAGDSGEAGQAAHGGSAGTGGTSSVAAHGGSSTNGGSASTNGGTTSNGGSASTNGGTGGASAAAGSAGTSCFVDHRALVPIVAGAEPGSAWIDGSMNCMGIQGAIFVVADEAGSTITLTESAGQICVKGVAKQVQNDEFDRYWGATVMIQLNSDGTTEHPYDAVAHSMHVFEATFSGNEFPDEIRGTLVDFNSTTEYCDRICSSGTQSVGLMAQAACWEDGVDGPTAAADKLRYLEYHVPSSWAADVPFDFCIGDLTAVEDDHLGRGTGGDCPSAGPGSCVGFCGNYAGSDNCRCGDYCATEHGDCCADYKVACL